MAQKSSISAKTCKVVRIQRNTWELIRKIAETKTKQDQEELGISSRPSMKWTYEDAVHVAVYRWAKELGFIDTTK